MTEKGNPQTTKNNKKSGKRSEKNMNNLAVLPFVNNQPEIITIDIPAENTGEE